MKRDHAIIVGILTGELSDLQTKLREADIFAERVSIDVIDGSLGGDKTVQVAEMAGLAWSEAKVDVQLMVSEPRQYVAQLAQMRVDRVFGHVEGMEDIDDFVEACEQSHLRWGLGVDLPTEMETITDEWWEQLEAVLLMSVPLGYSGQDFDTRVLEKIKQVRGRGFEGDVVIDGGMNAETIASCLAAGANQFSATSAIWRADDPGLSYRQLHEILAE